MATPLPFLFLALSLVALTLSSPSTSSTLHTLSAGSSLSTEKPEVVLTSPNAKFSAGFYSVGSNAYCFAIWFNHPSYSGDNRTVVWMANRDRPVNGRRSKLSLLKSGKLILTDADKFTVWATDIDSSITFSSVQLYLNDTGNLVLHTFEGVSLWESFDFPTDTLLPQQQLTSNATLVSSRSQSNFSSGFYKLYFDFDNVLRLRYDDSKVSAVFWPDPWLWIWDTGRSISNSSKIAILDTLGKFSSSDNFTFRSADYGSKLERRLKIDHDGNARLYSWDAKGEKWVISWQAKPQPCLIHGSCGPNSLCIYTPGSGSRECSCLPGFEMKNDADWSYGCQPKFSLSCKKSEADFLRLPHVDFIGNDYGRYFNFTFENCRKLCWDLCNCKAFQYSYSSLDGASTCYPKTLLLNGYRSTSFGGELYLKLPKSNLRSYDKPLEEFKLNCSTGGVTLLDRKYVKSHRNGTIKFMLLFAYGLGGFQIVCIFLVYFFLFLTQKNSGEDTRDYLYAVTGFRKFTYAELRKATRRFSEEIGRGAGGIVYKGVLSDHRVAAIKQLNEANQGDGEFLAEVSIIERLNHMNLIEMWGYCAEGKHKLLVYEYMDHGSLAKNFSSKALDCKKRYEIALGTAKGLAYLHEECLEWVLHCDVKPQNILLDSNYNPKVADFGLSKLQNRGGLNNSSFSRMRGTRGYMAPEWVFNLPITSKVDVYSYGIVVLEMVTGKSPTMGVHSMDDKGGIEQKSLVTWVREKKQGEAAIASWMGEIIDPVMEDKYDMNKMEILVGVALQCVQEDKDARPTMSQVVEMLLRHENDDLVHGSMKRRSSRSIKF